METSHLLPVLLQGWQSWEVAGVMNQLQFLEYTITSQNIHVVGAAAAAACWWWVQKNNNNKRGNPCLAGLCLQFCDGLFWCCSFKKKKTGGEIEKPPPPWIANQLLGLLDIYIYIICSHTLWDRGGGIKSIIEKISSQAQEGKKGGKDLTPLRKGSNAPGTPSSPPHPPKAWTAAQAVSWATPRGASYSTGLLQKARIAFQGAAVAGGSRSWTREGGCKLTDTRLPSISALLLAAECNLGSLFLGACIFFSLLSRSLCLACPHACALAFLLAPSCPPPSAPRRARPLAPSPLQPFLRAAAGSFRGNRPLRPSVTM